jgi:hypothetical protein
LYEKLVLKMRMKRREKPEEKLLKEDNPVQWLMNLLMSCFVEIMCLMR